MASPEKQGDAGMRPVQQQEQSKPSFVSAETESVKPVTGTGRSFTDIPIYPSDNVIQPKLSVSTPGDKYEQEADTIADKVIQPTANENQPVQKMELGSISPLIQAKGESAGPVSESLNSKINSSKGKGTSLDKKTQSTMSGKFGVDFSKVKIHADNESATMNKEINAKAFTVGNDIYFNKGQYKPGTKEGKRLLAHELTHTVQQKGINTIQRDIDETAIAGDTLYSLSRLYKVSVADIKSANKLTGNAIQAGQKLIIPGINPVNHTVQAGEGLYSIAKFYGVEIEAIKRFNNLPSDAIQANQVLKIPIVGKAAAATTTPPTKPAPPTPVTTPPAKPATTPAKPPATPAKPTTTHAKPPTTTPATTPATPTTTTPATTTSTAGKFSGHSATGDYSTGTVLEQSMLLKSDLKTHIKTGGADVFFTAGTTVTFGLTKGLWVEVTGPVSTNAAIPTPVMSGGSPATMTGWIRREVTDMTLGRFENLDIKDDSHFKKGSKIAHVGRDSPMTSVKGLVLHQTGSASAASTVGGYGGKIKAGSSVASHYVIGQTGDIHLTGGLDRIVDHVGLDNLAGGSVNPAVTSSFAVGIEHSGVPYTITSPHSLGPAAKGFTAQMAAIRTELGGLDLSPDLKKNLLALSDKALYTKLRDVAWVLYQDITGAQKRSSFLLAKELRKKYSLSVTDTYAHEHLSAKKIGEGENILEFHQKRESYPAKVAELLKLGSTVAALTTIIRNEIAVLTALNFDATPAENALIAKKDPAALKREAIRVKFYNTFYARLSQLDEMIQFLQSSKGKIDPKALSVLTSKWVVL